MAIVGFEEFYLIGRFDAFGQDFHVEALAEYDHTGCDGAVVC